MENGFILPLEKEIFIDQLKDIVDKAGDMLHEDMGDEKDATLSCSPPQNQMSEVGEVGMCFISAQIHSLCRNVTAKLMSVNLSVESAAWGAAAGISAEW